MGDGFDIKDHALAPSPKYDFAKDFYFQEVPPPPQKNQKQNKTKKNRTKTKKNSDKLMRQMEWVRIALWKPVNALWTRTSWHPLQFRLSSSAAMKSPTNQLVLWKVATPFQEDLSDLWGVRQSIRATLRKTNYCSFSE